MNKKREDHHHQKKINKMSDSKRMKHDISSSASSTADGINKKSLLSEYVQVVLQRGMKEGYKDSNLNLASR